MTSTRFSIAFAAVAIAVTVLILWRDPYRLITLGGHGELVWWAFFATMVAVTLTHAALLTIMLVRHRSWQPVESALFDFLCVDGLFWGSTTWLLRTTSSPNGIPIINVVLAALMFVAAVRFNVTAVSHYLLGWDRTAEWDGSDRRAPGVPGRRVEDWQR